MAVATALVPILAAQVWAAVPGVPDSPRPGSFPTFWAGWSNDTFGGEMGHNSDDYRTNAFNVGMCLDDRILIAVDDSMLTYQQSLTDPPTRSDEVTATVGYLFPEIRVDDLSRGFVAAGAGVRLGGNLGGQSVQNRWHDSLGYMRVDIPYEQRTTDGVGYVTGGWLWQVEQMPWESLSFLDRRLGVAVNGSALGSTGGEFQSTLDLKLVAVGRDASFYVGARQAFNAGTPASNAARAVADHEQGTWATFGSSTGAWYFEGGYNTNTQATFGRIGFMLGRKVVDTQAQIAELEGIIGIFQGYSLGLQYRWKPAWLRDLSDDHAAFLLDYRFGQYPGVDWNDNIIVVRQPMVGIDIAMAKPRDGFQVVPFVYAGVGVRQEKIEIAGVNPRYDAQSATRAVIQGGAGVRLYWGKLPQGTVTARYGISLVYDLWQPLGNATATGPYGTDTYQNRHADIGLRLAATVAW